MNDSNHEELNNQIKEHVNNFLNSTRDKQFNFMDLLRILARLIKQYINKQAND